MRLGVVEIKDVLRYDREPVRVDFQAIGPGLIAVIGANGEGKTTLMEAPAATWYREFPSRPKRELYDYAHGRTAELATTFQPAGETWFRAKLTLDAVDRGGKGIIQPIGPDGVLQTSVVDGLYRPYDEWMRAHLPSKTLFLASPFGAQNRRGGFAQIGEAAKRDLFSQLLGHDELERQAEICRAAAKAVEQGRVTLKTRRDLLARDLAALAPADLEQRASALAREEAAQRARRDALAQVIAELLNRQAAARAALKAHDEAVARQRDALVALQAIARERVTLDQERGRVAQVQECEIEAARQVEAAARADADLRIRNNRGVLADADAIRAAVDQLQAAEARLAALRASETEGREALAHAEQAQASTQQGLATALQAAADIRAAEDARAAWDAYDAAAARLVAAQAEEAAAAATHADALQALKASAAQVRAVDQARAALDLATADAALIERVPFGERCVAAGCAFVQQAQQSRASVPALEVVVATHAEVEARHAEHVRAVEEARAALDTHMRARAAAAVLPGAPGESRDVLCARIDQLAPVAAAQAAIERQVADAADAAATQRLWNTRRAEDIQDAEGAVAALRPLAGRLAALDAAEARIAEIERQLAGAAETWAREEAAAQDRAAAALARIDARLQAIAAEQPDLEARASAATADIEAHVGAAGQLAEIERHLADHQRQREEVAVSIATLQTQAGSVANQVEIATARQAELDLVERNLEILDTELLEWQLLAKALGRDGLPTLEIDAAGPTVSALCNDLLAACFGGRFTVDLVTQEAKAGGKGVKESFELKVYDSERGGSPRDLADLSGGEQIIVDECLKAALCVFNNQRSSVPMLTCWRDETTGPLDAENAPRYIAMLRRLQQLAGFEQVIFVTHAAEAAAQADAQIRCADGRVTVHLAPFAEAA